MPTAPILKSWITFVLINLLAGGGSPPGGAAAPRVELRQPQGELVWRTSGGRVTLLPHAETLAALGLGLSAAQPTATNPAFPAVDSVFALLDDPELGLVFSRRGAGFGELLEGRLLSIGTLLLALADGGSFALGNLRFDFAPDGAWTATDTGFSGQVVFRLSSGTLQFDRPGRRFEAVGLDVALDPDWAAAAGIPEAGGAVIATLVIETPAQPAPELAELAISRGLEVPDANCYVQPMGYGPDVIVGELTGTSSPSRLSNYTQTGAINGIRGYSVGTTSCNLGSDELEWISNTNHHPVIGQNLFRLKDGKFEQIGQSWLKHGFLALQGSTCCSNCVPAANGTHLGVRCSDPYSSGLNGDQTRLGPKFEVNASTGIFSYPYTAQGQTGDGIYKHLQVHESDLDPTSNPGALYFVEGQYVTPDDAAAGNQDNNASYRQVSVGSAPELHLLFAGPTRRERTAIYAWKDQDPTVAITPFQLKDGHLDLGFKETDLGGGSWRYEIALYNMNSDLSVQSLSVPLPAGSSPSNIGFHDVDYHSGEPFAGTDWTASVAAGGSTLTWATETFAQNPNANALRWGTLYNFRFDLDQRLGPFAVTVVPFKPGGNTVVVAPGYRLITAAAAGSDSRLRSFQPR